SPHTAREWTSLKYTLLLTLLSGDFHFPRKRPLIPLRVKQVLLITMGEVMTPGKIFLSAHIKIVAFRIVQYRINRVNLRHVHRSRRQTAIPVSIVWRFYFLMFIKDTLKGEIAHRKYQCRIGLEEHILLQSIDV